MYRGGIRVTEVYMELNFCDWCDYTTWAACINSNAKFAGNGKKCDNCIIRDKLKDQAALEAEVRPEFEKLFKRAGIGVTFKIFLLYLVDTYHVNQKAPWYKVLGLAANLYRDEE